MDNFTFISLWDIYHGLLTATQQEITDMYFNLDLTVSEIAEQKGISRQAVSECLSGCKKQLEEYEEKLGFCRAMREMNLSFSFLLTDAGRWAEKFKGEHAQFADEVEELEKVLSKDYTDEVQTVLSDPEKIKLMNEAAVKQGLKVN